MYKKNAQIQNPQRDCWERVEAVIKMSGMTTNGFARYIGLAQGENLYQIKRGHNRLSFDVANRIVSKYPQVNKLWLLTGEGPMTTTEASAEPRGGVFGMNASMDYIEFAAALILPELIKKPECRDPYTLAVEHAEKLMVALAKKGGEQ